MVDNLVSRYHFGGIGVRHEYHRVGSGGELAEAS